ncbi:Rap1a/Tai family immunity protein [Rhizobium brockwellii]
MNLKISSVVLAFILATQTGALAQEVGVYTTGAEITKSCRAYLQLVKANRSTISPQLAYDAGFCLGAVYLALDIDAFHHNQLSFNDNFPEFCLPNSTNSNDVAEVVANFVDTHPELRALTGYVLVRRAIASAWPC